MIPLFTIPYQYCKGMNGTEAKIAGAFRVIEYFLTWKFLISGLRVSEILLVTVEPLASQEILPLRLQCICKRPHQQLAHNMSLQGMKFGNGSTSNG